MWHVSCSCGDSCGEIRPPQSRHPEYCISVTAGSDIRVWTSLLYKASCFTSEMLLCMSLSLGQEERQQKQRAKTRESVFLCEGLSSKIANRPLKRSFPNFFSLPDTSKGSLGDCCCRSFLNELKFVEVAAFLDKNPGPTHSARARPHP